MSQACGSSSRCVTVPRMGKKRPGFGLGTLRRPRFLNLKLAFKLQVPLRCWTGRLGMHYEQRSPQTVWNKEKSCYQMEGLQVGTERSSGDERTTPFLSPSNRKWMFILWIFPVIAGSQNDKPARNLFPLATSLLPSSSHCQIMAWWNMKLMMGCAIHNDLA